MRDVIAIDPGVTRLGAIVLREHDDGTVQRLAAATFASPGKGSAILPSFSKRETFCRVYDLQREVTRWLEGVAEQHGMEEPNTVLAIERPVYNRNPRAFEIQWRLFQQLCAAMMDEGWVCSISEVHNGTAKATLTGCGNAAKDEMSLYSPIQAHHFPDMVDREAVTDAYAVGLSYVAGNPIYETAWDDPACVQGPVAECLEL